MPRLFVIMPFGVRELPTDGAPLDFDAVYDDLIRPAAQEAGWEPHRIDELAQPGVITDQYLRELYAADLVLADVSMPNGNVYYELGVRQAISAAGTLLVALEGTELPFDLSTQRVLFYSGDFSRESGPRRQLAAALRSFDPTTTTTTTTTNPVRTFLERMGLTSSPRHDDAAFEQDLNGRINRARNADQLVAVWHWAKAFRPLPASSLLALADHLADYRVYATAADVLRAAVRSAPGDYEVHRKLGFYLRQLGPEHKDAAMEHLSRARELNPDDPETLGIIGGLLKRQGRYVDAHQQYELGAELILLMGIDIATLPFEKATDDAERFRIVGIELAGAREVLHRRILVLRSELPQVEPKLAMHLVIPGRRPNGGPEDVRGGRVDPVVSEVISEGEQRRGRQRTDGLRPVPNGDQLIGVPGPVDPAVQVLLERCVVVSRAARQTHPLKECPDWVGGGGRVERPEGRSELQPRTRIAGEVATVEEHSLRREVKGQQI